MLVALGDQEPHDEGAARAGKLLDEGEEGAFEEFLGGELGGLHALAEHLEMRGDDAADHRLEQLDLGLEVEIGEALAHLGAGGDVLEPCLGKALLGEFLEGGGNDLLRADLFVAAPLSLGRLPLGGFCLCHGFRSLVAADPGGLDRLSALIPVNIMTDQSVPQWTKRTWVEFFVSEGCGEL